MVWGGVCGRVQETIYGNLAFFLVIVVAALVIYSHVCSHVSLVLFLSQCIQLDLTPCGVLTMQVKLYKEVQRDAG